MQMNRLATVALTAIIGLTATYSAKAAIVVADFNDNLPGQLAGQGGGTNLSGTWAASTNPAVVPGDLIAPLSTNYATPQSVGVPQSVQNLNTAATNANGQTTRTVATPLSGTIWFSFLVNPIDANARAGISFNTSTAFSPTDTPVLTRWAKVLTMVQASISLTVVAVLAARAVNIL